MKRRKFLLYSGALGAGAVASGLLPVWDSARFGKRLTKVSATRRMMGTLVTVTAFHESRDLAEQAAGDSFAHMEKVSRLLSRHDSTSPVSVLNRDGTLSGPPPELAAVLERAQHFHSLSDGVFDVTVEPLIRLYQEQFERSGSPPSERDVDDTAALVDMKRVTLSDHTVKFDRQGMGLTLDGIAKGYIVDCGAETLRTAGVEHGMINAGGDIRAFGGRAETRPGRWPCRTRGRRRDARS